MTKFEIGQNGTWRKKFYTKTEAGWVLFTGPTPIHCFTPHITEEDDINDLVADRLSQESGINITGEDYDDWMNGGEGYDVFDMAVSSFIGPSAHWEMDGLARLNPYLLWRLGLGPNKCGGIVFKK